MGGGATQTEGHRLRGVLLHDGRGGPGPVAEEDCGAHHQHRPRQSGATRPGQSCPGQSCPLELHCTGNGKIIDIPAQNYFKTCIIYFSRFISQKQKLKADPAKFESMKI